jgi:hypothetical protein
MLAADSTPTIDPTQFVHVDDAFTFDAELHDNLVERAEQVAFTAGELVIAFRLPDSLAAPTADRSPTNVAWAADFVQSNAWMDSSTTGLTAEHKDTILSFSRDDQAVVVASFDIGSAEVIQAMEQMTRNPLVLWSSPNFSYADVEVQEVTPSDPDFSTQYHHQLIGSEAAWDITYGDSSIIVAITDDGIAADHHVHHSFRMDGGDFRGMKLTTMAMAMSTTFMAGILLIMTTESTRRLTIPMAPMYRVWP